MNGKYSRKTCYQHGEKTFEMNVTPSIHPSIALKI
jgi:hypothetical protein